MQLPVNIPLVGDRGIAFRRTIGIFGEDLSGATFAMQVRLAPDAPGAALIDASAGISLAYGGTDTIANHIAVGRVARADLPPEYSGLSDSDELTLSMVVISIDAADMELATVPAGENGDDVQLAYDIIVTLDGIEDKYAYGSFAVRGTVTQ